MTTSPAEQETKAITPYLLLGESRRRTLTQRVKECVERWRMQWADEQSPHVRVEVREEMAGDWRDVLCLHAGTAQRPDLLLVVPSRSALWVAGMQAEGLDYSQRPPNMSSLAVRLEIQALTALARGILEAAAMRPSPLERSALTAEQAVRNLTAARYVLVHVSAGERRSSLNLLLAPVVAAALLPQPATATSLGRIEKRAAAIKEETVGVEVVLGSAELSVADLARLAEGDVIVMSESLSEAGELKIPGGARIAGVAAGRLAGVRAVQIKAESRKG